MERKTIMFDAAKTQQKTTKEILEAVYAALRREGPMELIKWLATFFQATCHTLQVTTMRE